MIKDKYELQGFSAPKMPKLKGHVKLIMRDHKTGKVEVSEGENIVTNVVSELMAANYLGGIDYSKILGTDGIWKTWFGGVLVFESAHANLDADKYYPPSSDENVLVAHAGQTSIDEDHDDDSTRGNPSTSEYVFSDNSAKIVWEWGRQKGNGTIRSLSLCHTDVGSYGLGSLAYDFKNNFEPFSIINQGTSFWTSYNIVDRDPKVPMAMYDDSHSISFFPKENTTDTITVVIRKLAYLKSGLLQTLSATDNQEVSFDIQVPFTFYNSAIQYSPYYYYEPETKYLWLFDNRTGASTWDKDDIKYCKIDTVNQTLVDFGSGVYYKTIHSDTEDIAPLGMFVAQGGGEFANIHRIGNYFYFPTATSPVWSGYTDQRGTFVTGYKAIELDSTTGEATANQFNITFNDTQQHPQSLMGNGILVNNGRVVNYHTGYTCKPIYTVGANTRVIFLSNPNSPTTYGIVQKGGGYASLNVPQYILANKMLLTTKFNLSQAVQKDANKSMTVEYTLTEVSGS